MDALELLKEDHQRVKELFKQGDPTEDYVKVLVA